MSQEIKPMSNAMWETSKYIIGPVVAIMIGAVLGSYTHPTNKIVNVLRASAAGIVLAAVSTEMVPDIAEVEGFKDRAMVIFGIVLGASTMILIRTIFSKYKSSGNETIPWEMVISVAIDFFIDAMLIGMSLSLGPGIEANTGLVMTVALGFEMMLLTITTASQMSVSKVSRGKIMGIAALLGTTVLAGAYIGNLVASKFKGTPVFYAMLAFGVAALIWLIAEELLADIGTKLDGRLSASMIFIGFMLVIISGWLGHKH